MAVSSSIASITRLSAPFSAYYCYYSSSSTLWLNRVTRRLIWTISTKKHQQYQSQVFKRMATTSALDKEKTTAPYGSWSSPITADVVAGASKRLGGTALDSNGLLIWLESRPSEAGYLYIYLYIFLIFFFFNNLK